MRRGVLRTLSLALLPLLLVVLASPVQAERRVALVIGNGAYPTAALKNPVNDATDMAASLQRLGFEVALLINANQQQMDSSVREFGLKLRQGGAGLFYYAGHGLQVAGENYLVPVNANIQTESDVRFTCLPAGMVLGKMEDARNDLNIIILDACRNNPFARSFRSAEQGLAKMDAPTGSLISYATAPGSVASDGAGKNGLFTQHLLKNMATPNLSVEEMFKRVRQSVVTDTNRKQVPWEASSLIGQFYFSGSSDGPPPKPTSLEAVAPKPSAPAARMDLKAEKKRIAEEAERLRREKQELAQYQALQADKERQEVERQKLEQAKLLAMASRPKQAPPAVAPAAAPQPASHAAQFAQLARVGLPEARAYFEQAVQARPADADARAGLAMAQVFSRREADARYHLQRLNESNAQSAGARLAKGLLLGLEGNPDAAYQLSRAQEDGADRALVLLCQAAAAERKGEMEQGRRLMEDYAGLVPEAERGEYAKALAKGLNLVGNMVGSFKWVMPPTYEGGYGKLDITFTRSGSGLAATATGKFWTFSGDIAVQDVLVKGKTLMFTIKVYKVLFGSLDDASTYRFTCDLSGSLDVLPVSAVEWVPGRDGKFVPRRDYANTRLERQ